MGSAGALRVHRDRALQEPSSTLQCFTSCFSCPPQEQGWALSAAGAGPPEGGCSQGPPGRAGWLHPYTHPCCGLCPVFTVRACFYFIYFTKQAKDSIKLFRQFEYLHCQCGRRGGLAVSWPLISRSWRGAHVPDHTLPSAQTLPPVHFVQMTALCCPWMKPMTKYAQGAQTPSLTPPLHDFCCSIAANCSCQRGSTVIRGLHP